MPASASPLPPEGPIATPAAKPIATMPSARATLSLREGALMTRVRPPAAEPEATPGRGAAARAGFQKTV